MANSVHNAGKGWLALVAALCFSAVPSGAANLTVCGILDGSGADSDGLANGAVSTACAFGANGSFAGRVQESADPLNYWVFITGDFRGAGSSSFVSSQFSLSGSGDLFPFVNSGLLTGPNGDVAVPQDFLSVTATATNFSAGPASAFVQPVSFGPLPVGLSGFASPVSGSFGGLGTLTLAVTFVAGTNDSYSFPPGYVALLASTDPTRIIPEPSTLFLFGSALAALALFARRPAKR